MVKTDDYDNYVGNTTTAAFGMKEEKEEEMLGEEEEDGAGHANWLPPRSKSAGLKYTEYESDESGRMMPNSKIMQSVDGGDVDDRRIRRQIANCNERRRMQSINAGFQQLRQLLPRKDGDKMSKASILAATAEFIQNLLSERNNLMEENAMSAAKRRRLDVGEKNGAPTMEEVPANIIECIKTIGQLRELLQKETQLRMEYEKELSELRVKARFGDASSFTSSGSDNFSPNSSTSSTENNNNRSLLIELKQQENQQHVFRPTPLPPLTDVNILSLSSAIASLAKSSPTAASGVQTPATASGLLTSPIGIHNHQQQQQFASNDGLSQPNGCSLFVGQPQPPNNHHQQQPIAIQPSGQQQAELNPATISQRNLQALVLAIRHLEGNTSGSNGANLIVR